MVCSWAGYRVRERIVGDGSEFGGLIKGRLKLQLAEIEKSVHQVGGERKIKSSLSV